MRYGAFQKMVLHLNERMTFVDMQVKSGSARSLTWFNNVANGNSGVNPPPPELLPKFAKLFKITDEQVAALVAESWYGVQPSKVSGRVRRLAPAIDTLEADDFRLVEQLVARLPHHRDSDGS